jgi:hypothetical protein
MTVTPVMVMMAYREMESHDRAGAIVNGGRADWRVDYRRRLINNGRGLVDDRRLAVNHSGLSINNGRLAVDDHLRCGLINDLRGLMDHDRLLNDDGRRFCIDRPRFECFGNEQARSHACHDFSSGCPFLVAGVGPSDRTTENSQGCCYH